MKAVIWVFPGFPDQTEKQTAPNLPFKGKLGEGEVSIGNFNRKAPKFVKNHVGGSKIDQVRTKWPKATIGIRPIGLNWRIHTVAFCLNSDSYSSF